MSVEILPVPAEEFGLVRSRVPELAACLVLAGGHLTEGQGLVPPPDQEQMKAALQRLLPLITRNPPAELRVFVGFRPQPTPTAVAVSHTALLYLPASEPTSAGDAARTVATAWLVAQRRPAPPEEGVSELLLRFAESLAWLGSLALANTPPELLPLGQWVEPKHLAPALEGLVRDVLATDEPYRLRRARLRELAQPGRANPELAQAAAYLLETFGRPDEARQRPLQLLRAWAQDNQKRFPPMPRLLRSLLAQGGQGTVPRKPSAEDREAMRLDEALRRAWTQAPSQALGEDMPADAAKIWHARRRAGGYPVPAPQGVTAGRGFCLVKPEPPDFAVYWRADGRDELLLLWPTWVLSPQLGTHGEDLYFADPQGIWRVSLSGGGVELLKRGSFRLLRAGPGEQRLAALTWPEGNVVSVPEGRTLATAARGLAWLQDDLLLVSQGEALRLAHVSGEVGPAVSLACSTQLVTHGGRIIVAQGPPCPAQLVTVEFPQGGITPLLKLPSSAADLAAIGPESLVFLTSEGVFVLSQGNVKRLDQAFALGPG
ncbi:MAG: hypothetical protein NZ869_03350 [Thermoanaerobaculum sp.]|nr:hypothetical protein [Thermoanaerobaculum sp.]MDW7967287.1 hypothetical protein [Thermoanaerobaculum sp.]